MYLSIIYIYIHICPPPFLSWNPFSGFRNDQKCLHVRPEMVPPLLAVAKAETVFPPWPIRRPYIPGWNSHLPNHLQSGPRDLKSSDLSWTSKKADCSISISRICSEKHLANCCFGMGTIRLSDLRNLFRLGGGMGMGSIKCGRNPPAPGQ